MEQEKYDYLRREERVALALKKLYRSYGYQNFKLCGFEEYSLYATNSNFLNVGKIATFSVGGRLLSLRPDVTLSIIKNVKTEGITQKLFYEENVYRTPVGGEDLREVKQFGCECIGKVNMVEEAEMTELAIKTLEETGGNYVLDIAHMGIISAFFDLFALSEQDTAVVREFLRQKNAHGFEEFALKKGIDRELCDRFVSLIHIGGEAEAALKSLEKICMNETMKVAAGELKNLVELLGENGKKVNINFSIVGDDAYYNGLIFKGYVEGIPRSVLSGGRYDKLLEKFGKNAQAIGFALYFGELTRLYEHSTDRAQIILTYNPKSAKKALQCANQLRKQGKSVLLCEENSQLQGDSLKVEEVKL